MRALLRGLSHPMFRRTCTQCGYTWTVSKWFSKPRPKGGPWQRRGGASMSIAQGVVASNETMAETVAQLRTCARCQSKQYSQVRLWHLSKQESEDM